LRPFRVREYAGLTDGCRIWKVSADSPAVKTAVTSSIPTLVMEGDFDPVTPPVFGQDVARTLDHSFVFVFPGLGHFTARGGDCPMSVLGQFLDDPSRRPDDACLGGMPEPFS
jgi:pimeloyl-ACP methyl ester carboxylesterase